MKTVIYECNYCGRKSDNSDKLLGIGSNNNSLSIKNNANGASLTRLEKHDDLHFCSQNCLNNYLFKPLNKVEVVIYELRRLESLLTEECNKQVFKDMIQFLNSNSEILESKGA